jgi:hypothetical protein
MNLFNPANKPDFYLVSTWSVLLKYSLYSVHAQIYRLAPYIYTLIQEVFFGLLYSVALCVCKAFPYPRLNVFCKVLPCLIFIEYLHDCKGMRFVNYFQIIFTYLLFI